MFSSFIEDFNRLSAETSTSISSASLVSETCSLFSTSTDIPFILFLASIKVLLKPSKATKYSCLFILPLSNSIFNSLTLLSCKLLKSPMLLTSSISVGVNFENKEFPFVILESSLLFTSFILASTPSFTTVLLVFSACLFKSPNSIISACIASLSSGDLRLFTAFKE